jgi:hypothetical protein
MTVETSIGTIQALIDTGDAWMLEGHVGRTCMDAIQFGYAMLGEKSHRDYYGNIIPSRYEVQPGTPGSPEYYEKTQEDIDNA